jgi:hypothetical protein
MSIKVQNWAIPKTEKAKENSPSRAGVSEILRRMALRRPLFKNFDNMLRQILAAMSESTAAIRSKAIKALTAIIEVNFHKKREGNSLKILAGE